MLHLEIIYPALVLDDFHLHDLGDRLVKGLGEKVTETQVVIVR
jgi:hypothetical protein